MVVLTKTQRFRNVKYFKEGSVLSDMNTQLKSLQKNYANEILDELSKEKADTPNFSFVDPFLRPSF